MIEFSKYLTPDLTSQLPGVKQARTHIEDGLPPMEAMSRVFDECDLTINYPDEVLEWKTGSGVLLVGDHRSGFEYLPLMAIFGQLEREDINMVAKSHSFMVEVMGALGDQAMKCVTTVMPTTLAAEHSPWNRDIPWRITQNEDLEDTADLKRHNNEVMLSCSKKLENGEIVRIYPAGGVMDATRVPWRKGVGKIIKSIDTEHYGDTIISPFRFPTFSKMKLLQSFCMLSLGLTPPPYSIELEIGNQGTIEEIFSGAADLSTASSEAITEELRRQFIDSFYE